MCTTITSYVFDYILLWCDCVYDCVAYCVTLCSMCHCVFVITLSIKCLLKSVTLLLRDCEDHCAKNEDCVTSVKCYSVCCGGLYGGLCVCLIG